MNLFDRVKLLIRSTVSGALGGHLPELPGIGPTERSDKLLDKAQARVEMLQGDLARAEKRGDAELANRLRREISDLQTTLDKARKKAGQPAVAPVAQQARPAESTTSAAPREQATGALANEGSGDSQSKEEQEENEANEAMDNSRVADQIRKMRAQK